MFKKKPRETIRLLRAHLESEIYAINCDVVNGQLHDHRKQDAIVERIRRATTLDQAIDVLEKMQIKHRV